MPAAVVRLAERTKKEAGRVGTMEEDAIMPEEDTIMPEESKDEAAYEPSGNLVLDGEAWRKRGNTTYTSLLDRYGAADLFSDQNTERYREMAEKERLRDSALTEYLFSGQMQTESDEADMVEKVFSEEIQLSRVKDYSRAQEDNTVYFAMGELLFVLVFLYILIKVNAARKRRRDSDAVKIDMESEGEAGYGPVSV